MVSYHSKIFEKKYPQLTDDIIKNVKIENVFILFKDFSKNKMMIKYLLNLLRNKYDIQNVFDINEIKIQAWILQRHKQILNIGIAENRL